MLLELAYEIVASSLHVVAKGKQMWFTSSVNVRRSNICKARRGTTEDLFQIKQLGLRMKWCAMTFLLLTFQAKTE